MKLIAPIAALIAAASAGQIYSGQSAESYAKSAENYQSALEYQQRGLYSDQSQAPQTFGGHQAVGHEVAYDSRPSGEKAARILSFNNENNGHQYQYSYETENGIKAEEAGQTSEHGGSVSHGAYSYKGDDGQTYTVTYTADEHGFHPQGAHLPTPPPMPEAIAKSLEQNAKDEAAGIFDDGKYKEQSNQGIGHGYQQYDASYQTHGYQTPSGHSSGETAYHIPSGHASGADLAYHAHAGNALSGISAHSGAQSAYASAGHGSTAQLAYHAPASHGASAQLAYQAPSHGSSAQLAFHAPSSHGSSAQTAYQHHFVPSVQTSSAQSYHVPTSHSSVAQLAYNAHSGYAHSGQTSGSEMAYLGHY
ncbi:hypothetical protein PYW07_005573 [Mythimna separata]|uniref:Uncharacterized protein n=1 Tax=Mythimna separata TaxID=271217 RepID=A0AAD8DQT7_MYTSE|nr:hypothetical protein PYW07_005573 [Mythimna separata]